MEADSARLLATNYLEPFVNRLEDPFQVALLSYALLVAGSNVRNEAFTRLDEIKRVGEWREQVWVMAYFHCLFPLGFGFELRHRFLYYVDTMGKGSESESESVKTCSA